MAADLIPQEQINGKYGYVNPQGFLMIRARYDMARPFKENLAAVEVNGKWGFIDENGKAVVKCQYKEVRDFHDGHALVCNKEGFWGAIDKKGEEVVPCSYNEPSGLVDRLLFVRKTDKN